MTWLAEHSAYKTTTGSHTFKGNAKWKSQQNQTKQTNEYILRSVKMIFNNDAFEYGMNK